MKIGISTAALFCRKTNSEALPILKDVGADLAEVFLTSFSEYKLSYGAEMAKNNPGLPVHSVHVLTTQIEPQLFNPHPLVRMDSRYFLEQAMRSAGELGAKYYTFHGLARCKKSARIPGNENWKRLGTIEAEVFDFCKKLGVTLCQENVEWSTYNRPGVFRILKEYCPDLKGVLDLKQARLSGYDYKEYLREMAGDMTHVHVSDLTREGKMCLPGKGIFPFEELLEELDKVGFCGPLIIEPYAEDFNGVEELAESVAYLKGLTR
ncbi:MAG: sugar phosphate isomerase/epimerase [Clostridia bacterium]|nr:sugar phosphate isomerase/epimerase [Clostridia bacterium]